ncbi:MAG: MarR family transcriptional regulator [Nocardioides sp.]|uniref:MarR family winged helix-turn-helix transcriptional regulator n=1 Tax=Nocardioides sp. TaxID=35761 RepID=UPI0039E42EBE
MSADEPDEPHEPDVPAGPGDAELAAAAAELRITIGRLRRALRFHGGSLGLTPSQSEALGQLFRDGPQTITALAGRIGVRSQSVGATVAALVEAGLVRVTQDAADGRQRIAEATDRAEEVVAASRAGREDWLVDRLGSLSPAEQRRLIDAIPLLTRLLDAP